ncbi:MAG: TolC family protein [Acidiferrobacterales bacterium]
MRIRFSLFLGLAIAGLGAAHAAEVLTLDQAIRYSLDHNFELKARDEQTLAARARVDAAKSGRMPQIDARYLVRRSDNPLDAFADKLNTRSVNPATDFTASALNHPASSTLHAGELALQLPIYTGGKLSASIRRARDDEQAADFDLDRARQKTVFRVTRAFLAAQAAIHGVEIATDAVAAAQGHADTTAHLVREGRIVVSDRMTAELNLAATESAREQAINRRRQAMDQLKLAMGLPMDEDIELPPWEDVTATVPDDLPAIEQGALTTRKDLQAARSMTSAGRAGMDEARAALKPQLSIVAKSDWFDDSFGFANNSQSIMGVVSMNLYSGGRDTSELAAARHQADESELRAMNLQQEIQGEVRAAYYDIDEATARRKIAAQNVAKARDAVRLIKQRYGEGRTILLDVLMGERLVVEARNEKLASSLELATGLAALKLAEGTLEPPQ